MDVRINNIQTAHSGSVYSRDYVIDYTSLERDDLIGNTPYYTKANGQSYAELTYDAWGMPESPNKLLNNDHGNYVYATYTGHIFDTTLDIYFAEARFYDANTRTWLAMDPIKDGDNWYQYCYSNPLKYWYPTGLKGFLIWECLDVNSITDWFHAEWNDMQDVLGRIGQGALGVLQSALSAVQVIMGGTAAIAAIAGLAGASSVALPILIMTLVGGGISAVFGGSNFVEGINMIKNAIEGNNEIARNPIRDDYFNKNPWLYDLIDVIAGIVTALGSGTILKGVKTGSISTKRTTEIEILLDKMPELTGTNREKLLSTVQDSKLRSIINELYRPGASIGDGGTAAMLINEFYEGESKHLIKAKARLNELNKLAKSGNLSLNDLNVLDALRIDLENAISLFE